MAYSVTIEGNKVTGVQEIPTDDYDELGIDWALSELRDTYRHAKVVNADFSLADDAELREFLEAVKKLIGADAIGDAARRFLPQ